MALYSAAKDLDEEIRDPLQSGGGPSADVRALGNLEPRCWTEKRKKIVIGCVIVVLLAVSWVGAQQYAQSAVQLASFDAPYFTTWIGTCWMILCFPLYAMLIALMYNERLKTFKAIRESATMFQTPRISAKQFFLKIVPMNILWLVTNYLYIYGLKFIAATDASAIFASNVAFVYMLSLCILRERLYFIRIFACILCISGVVLFAYAEGFSGGSELLTGIIMAVAAAFGAALYNVIFKLMLGAATLGQVSLFLTLLGVSNALFMWVVFVILYTTGVECFAANDIPWSALIPSNFLGLVFNFSVNFGVAYTYPLFIAVATMLGIPLNAVVDIIVKDVTFSPLRLTSAILVILGFCVMLLPDHWNDHIHDALCKFRNGDDENDEDRSSNNADKIGEEKM